MFNTFYLCYTDITFQPRIERVDDLITKHFLFLWTSPQADNIQPLADDISRQNVIRAFLDKLDQSEACDFDWVKETTQNLAGSLGVKYKVVMQTLRMALSGLKVGYRQFNFFHFRLRGLFCYLSLCFQNYYRHLEKWDEGILLCFRRARQLVRCARCWAGRW